VQTQSRLVMRSSGTPGLFAFQAAGVVHVGGVLIGGADSAVGDTLGVGRASDEAPAFLTLF